MNHFLRACTRAASFHASEKKKRKKRGERERERRKKKKEARVCLLGERACKSLGREERN